LTNERVSEEAILSGHFETTRQRFKAAEGPILVLQDTCEISYQREHPERIGCLVKVPSDEKDKEGRRKLYTVCGILMHASLAVTSQGLPLGLAAIQFWTRKKFKANNALKNQTQSETNTNQGKRELSLVGKP